MIAGDRLDSSSTVSTNNCAALLIATRATCKLDYAIGLKLEPLAIILPLDLAASNYFVDAERMEPYLVGDNHPRGLFARKVQRYPIVAQTADYHQPARNGLHRRDIEQVCHLGHLDHMVAVQLSSHR
jgi:hypothetical protein